MVSNSEKRKLDESDSDAESSDSDEQAPLLSKEAPPRSQKGRNDPRFNQPPQPSPLKRLFLISFLLFLFWAAFKLRASLLEAKRNPKIIYATRQSCFNDG